MVRTSTLYFIKFKENNILFSFSPIPCNESWHLSRCNQDRFPLFSPHFCSAYCLLLPPLPLSSKWWILFSIVSFAVCMICSEAYGNSCGGVDRPSSIWWPSVTSSRSMDQYYKNDSQKLSFFSTIGPKGNPLLKTSNVIIASDPHLKLHFLGLVMVSPSLKIVIIFRGGWHHHPPLEIAIIFQVRVVHMSLKVATIFKSRWRLHPSGTWACVHLLHHLNHPCRPPY